VCFKDGDSWSSFQLNLPIVPITDLTIKEHDLVIATQGRAFWILEDLMPLHHAEEGGENTAFNLMRSYPSVRGVDNVRLRYFFGGAPESASTTLRITETDGTIIKSYTEDDGLSLDLGMNEFSWNARYEDAEDFPGLIMWSGSVRGPQAVPGDYQARLVVGDDSVSVPFTILKDPRSSSPVVDLQEQFDFLIDLRDKLSETHIAIKNIRSLRTAVNGVMDRMPEDHVLADSIKSVGKKMLADVKDVEEALYQTKNKSGQDPLNFPIRLNNKLAAVGGVVASGDYRPTDQSYMVRDELVAQIDAQLDVLAEITSTVVPAFNELVREAQIPAVSLEN
jgi:hypothetical protein